MSGFLTRYRCLKAYKIPNLLSGLRKGPWPFVLPPKSFLQTGHTHTFYIYIDSFADILYYPTQLVQMHCTSVYTTHINGTHKHTH